MTGEKKGEREEKRDVEEIEGERGRVEEVERESEREGGREGWGRGGGEVRVRGVREARRGTEGGVEERREEVRGRGRREGEGRKRDRGEEGGDGEGEETDTEWGRTGRVGPGEDSLRDLGHRDGRVVRAPVTLPPTPRPGWPAGGGRTG